MCAHTLSTAESVSREGMMSRRNMARMGERGAREEAAGPGSPRWKRGRGSASFRPQRRVARRARSRPLPSLSHATLTVPWSPRPRRPSPLCPVLAPPSLVQIPSLAPSRALVSGDGRVQGLGHSLPQNADGARATQQGASTNQTLVRASWTSTMRRQSRR